MHKLSAPEREEKDPKRKEWIPFHFLDGECLRFIYTVLFVQTSSW